MRIRPLLLASALLISGCGGPQTPRDTSGSTPQAAPVVLTPCDDGGDGGVVIGGVCL